MSPNKTLYIRDDDQDAWDRADAAAHATRQSLSQYLTGLIRRHIPETPISDGDLQKITVKVGDGHRMWTEGFTGRWLAQDDGPDYQSGIALTKRGKFVWYDCVPDMKEGELTVYASLEDLERSVEKKNWPNAEDLRSEESQKTGLADFRGLLAEAAKSLGQEHVFWRDI